MYSSLEEANTGTGIPPSNAENYSDHISVPSSSSGSSFRFRRRRTQVESGNTRKNPNAKTENIYPTGFRPIDPMAEHGYRIDIAKDGSMITAVPIDEHPFHGGGSKFQSPRRRLRSSPSPILYSQTRASFDGSTARSTQGLLDAGGKQRHKMKRMRPAFKTNSTKHPAKVRSDDAPFPKNSLNDAARVKLKHAKRYLAFTGANNDDSARQQPRKQSAKPPIQSQPKPSSKSRSRSPKVRWDLSPKQGRRPQQQPQSQPKQVEVAKSLEDTSFGSFSFPLLTSHKFDDSTDGCDEEEKSNNENIADDETNGDATGMLKHHHTKPDVIFEQKDGTVSFDALLQQRMAEIQSQKKGLAEIMSKKDRIKGTLITGNDVNLERNRKQMMVLEEEMKDIQWYLMLHSKKNQGHLPQQHMKTENNVSQQNQIEQLSAEAKLARSPSGAYDLESIEVGDPSITADTESVADLFCKDKASKMVVAGLDPPTRPSPLTTKDEVRMKSSNRGGSKDPDGLRMSAVFQGAERFRFGKSINAGTNGNRISSDRVKQPPKVRIPPPPTRKSVHRPPKKSAPTRTVPSMERLLPKPQHSKPPRQHSHPWHVRRMEKITLPHSPKREKSVHFDLPQESGSCELRFETINSTDSTSTHCADVAHNVDEDGISWKEEHFDVNTHTEKADSLVSLKPQDKYESIKEEHEVVVSEHGSRESDHRRHNYQSSDGMTEKPVASRDDNNGDQAVSSDSVETNPDLGFIHAVAAVVIQTAVRRYLAEIAVEERLYAVHVIQTAVCNWMARKQNNHFDLYCGVAFHDKQNSKNTGEIHQEEQYVDRSFHEQNHPTPFSRELAQRTKPKHVTFEDDYNDFCNFAATEIQRCYRGWWTRDGLYVDHFAATTLQRVFRGWWARERLDVDQYCALEIQRIVRGHLARISYIYDLYCIIVVQCVVRRYLAFYTSAVRLASILHIQAVYRGYRVREELRRYVRNGQEVAATFIQSQWRSYDANMNYINSVADILIVQSVARRWLVLRNVRGKIGIKPKYDNNWRNRDSGQPHANCNRSIKSPMQTNTHSVWQQHRLNVVSKQKKPVSMVDHSSYPEGFDVFHRDSVGGNEWYDGNKSDTSHMLKSWKGRKNR